MRRLHPNRLTDLDIVENLMPVDRIFQRWARSVGCGMPEEAWEGTQSRPTELPTDAAIAVDRYVCSRPEEWKRFIHSWYRSQHSSSVIAKRFNVGRDDVYSLWRCYLRLAREAFLAIPCVAELMRAKDLEAA